MSFYLAIVSPTDAPLYQLSFSSSRPPAPSATSPSSSSFPSWSTFTAPNGADNTAAVDGARGRLTGALLESKSAPERDRVMCQMIAHMSLDSVEEVMEGTGALYIKNVDRHNEWIVSAFLPTGVKFILLHDVKNDDGIRTFFVELWEIYIKVLMNPFHTVNTPITSPAFEARIKAIAKKHL
ncbi:hypothetical protein B9479_005763 [Cryptococcus floricola]|uniref:Trafficking protein particle complex subunit n=1 Tax=Cryptococcus floricola TaxID=2591691 RepID=A0A5D3AQ62_9TREE|nr:hypothetical protein B9479_005763 [Cryptococcus floricola]